MTLLLPTPIPTDPAARSDGLFRSTDLDPIAWQVLVHEGALRVVHPGVALPVRRRPTPRHRAVALVGALPRGWLFGGSTAYWVHVGGSSAPSALALISPPDSTPPQDFTGRVLHQQVLPARDRMELAGVALTTPLRTAVDLACLTAPTTSIPRLVRLAEHGVDLNAALNRLAGLGRRRGVLRGDRALHEALRRSTP